MSKVTIREVGGLVLGTIYVGRRFAFLNHVTVERSGNLIVTVELAEPGEEDLAAQAEDDALSRHEEQVLREKEEREAHADRFGPAPPEPTEEGS